jgi:hypothetical protein
MKATQYNILIAIAFIMAIIQAPLVYYYTFGMFDTIIGFGLTIFLLVKTFESSNFKSKVLQKLVLLSTILIGILPLFFGDDFIENLDWELRRSSRNEIVNLVKSGKLKPNSEGNNVICTLDSWNIPPISIGGNEITIYYTDENKIKVEFYISRGIFHYSAFVYTNDPKEIQEMEREIYLDKGLNKFNKKLDENWYRMFY